MGLAKVLFSLLNIQLRLNGIVREAYPEHVRIVTVTSPSVTVPQPHCFQNESQLRYGFGKACKSYLRLAIRLFAAPVLIATCLVFKQFLFISSIKRFKKDQVQATNICSTAEDIPKRRAKCSSFQMTTSLSSQIKMC